MVRTCESASAVSCFRYYSLVEKATKGVCLVIGAGDGLGGAIAKAFAREGHPVCITRRARHLDQLKTLQAALSK